MGESQERRRDDRTSCARHVGDGDSADAPAGGGRGARGGAIGRRHIAAGETGPGAGRQRGRREDRRGPAQIIQDHHVGERDVARVGHRAAVSQQPTGNRRIDRTVLGESQERRGNQRAGGRRGVRHQDHAVVAARGCHRAANRAGVGGRSEARGKVRGRTGRQTRHGEHGAGRSLAVDDGHVIQSDVAGIRDCPGVSNQTTGGGGRGRTGQRDRDAWGRGDRANGRNGVRDRGGCANVIAGSDEGGGDRAGIGRNGVSAGEVGGRAGGQGRQCEHRWRGRVCARGIASPAEEVEQVGPKAHVRGGKGQFRSVGADNEPVGHRRSGQPCDEDGSKSGNSTRVMAQVEESICPVSWRAQSCEDQRINVGSDGKAIGNGPRQRRVDGPERRKPGRVMADIIKQIGAITDVGGGKGQSVEVGADDEMVRGDSDHPAWSDAAEG